MAGPPALAPVAFLLWSRWRMRWQDEFRQFFPITRDRVYANIAYTSPLSPRVASAVADFFDGIAHARSDKPSWLADADALRARLAR